MALAIVGLAGVFQSTMAAIAAIILGASILNESGIHLAGFRRYFALPMEEEAGTKILGGIAGIVLGILALLGVAPLSLLSVAIIVFGGAFFLGGNPLAGVAGIVLGILAVVGVDPWTLILVGLLTLGSWALLSGSTTATHVLSEKVA
jgi:hypothetical protein